MNNDCIRFLGVLFPNIEKLILPCVNDRLRVPQRLLSSFPKLSHVQIFFLPPFNSWRSCYRQDVIDCQNLDYTFVQNFAKILRFKSDQSNLVSIPNNAKSEDVINTLKYFVETERFSLDKTDIITSLHPTSFTPSLIDYILQVHEKQQKAGYERITFTQERIMNSSLFFGLPDAIMDYMLETQFFKKLTSTESIISSSFVNSLLTSITSLKMAKLLFEQAEWPFVFDEVKNPLLILIANSRNTSVTSELISFFCNLKPGLISLGDENGIISNEVASLNILNLYLNMQKGLNADDSIIEALHRNGADITFVCPNTGNNFLHICPYSEYLAEHLPKEYFLAKNNRNNNPFERLLKRIEVDNDLTPDKVRLAIHVFCKAYKKYDISLDDLTFENDMSLLHKIISLQKSVAIPELVMADLNCNKTDNQGKTPLHLYIETCPEHTGFETAEILIDAMDVEVINKEDHSGKSPLCALLERYAPLPFASSFSFMYIRGPTEDNHLKIIELLLSKGADLNRSIQSLDGDVFVKGNIEHNRVIVLASLLYSAPIMAPTTLANVLKYWDNLNELLVTPTEVQGVKITPLCFMLSSWVYNSTKVLEMQKVFEGDHSILDKELLKKSIITLNDQQVDPVLYVLFNNPYIVDHIFQVLNAILFIPIQPNNTGMWWTYQECNRSDLCKALLGYQYEDLQFGTMNILHSVCKAKSENLLSHFLTMLTSNAPAQCSTLLASKTSKGYDVLDIISQYGIYNAGKMLITYAEQYLCDKIKWSKQNLRSAFSNHKYEFCFLILCENDELVDEFTLDELMEICIGYTLERTDYDKDFQVSIIDMLEFIFKRTNNEQKSKLNCLTKPFAITRFKPNQIRSDNFSRTLLWKAALVNATSACSKISRSIMERETIKRDISWLELSYWKGLNYLVAYIIQNDTSHRKRKQILTNSNLKASTVIEWITRKIQPKGATILHLLCEDLPSGRNYMPSVKHELLDDLLKFLDKTDQFDEVVNIQDDNGESPLFYAIRNQSCYEEFLRVSDLKLKNKEGKTVDQCYDVTFCAKYFEESSEAEEQQRMKDETDEEKKVIESKKKSKRSVTSKKQTKKKK
ncbi:hypothetical protein FDP41_012714 [Naegleria fowleri]|uniref:Uncharacterized protein n=1 Tax=Naegleria fowleri TaxID=5763 RepID=A0A6A5BZU2_NAEFO|nr:uncharacterized protein FDP41_012714 [Naegleria fowleri]KAF0980926.1 hypothetical protein FDP41_012714 [Naegleria fowleri]